MAKITLRPGTPDDDNREYLPESIKGSDIVVNENGNNSQPYPELLEEREGVVVDGLTDRWFVYVPESYDPTTPTPLVVSLHGGLMTGWGQAIYTSWTLVADREGFICLFPDASQRRFWLIDVPESDREAATTPNEAGVYLNPPPSTPEENHDLQMILGQIDGLKEQYNIDAGRIFIQGMSMGNAMTGQMARQYGNLFAGAAGSGGPTSPGLLFDDAGAVVNRGGPLAIWQSRLDHDDVPPHYGADVREVVRINREYWLEVNGAAGLPAIKIEGEDNFAFYRGEHADLVHRDVYNRDHGQTFDDAQLVWDYLFSGLRRSEDGRIQDTGSALRREGDTFAVAVSEGRSKAWLSGAVVELPSEVFTWEKLKYHGLDGGSKVRGSYQYVPLSFIARAFGGNVDSSDGGASATLTLEDGRTLQFARGSIGCVIDNRVRSMLAEAVQRDGELHISLQWIAEFVLGLRTTSAHGVLYVTDHHALLSANMAHLIDDLLAV